MNPRIPSADGPPLMTDLAWSWLGRASLEPQVSGHMASHVRTRLLDLGLIVYADMTARTVEITDHGRRVIKLRPRR